MTTTEPTEALSWDFKQQDLFVDYFNQLPQKPTSTIRFFDHGEFYYLHGEDAVFASKFISTIINTMGDDRKLQYISIEKNQFEQFIRELLLVKQYRVEVYVQPVAHKVNDWVVKYKGSPGNLSQFEEILFENAAINFSNYVLGIKFIKGRQIAVACVSTTELKFQVCHIDDNECFTELEALIAQIGPRECIIPQGDSTELETLKTVLERNSVLVAKVKRKDFSSENIIQDLQRLLYFHEDQQRNVATFSETKLIEALQCLSAVIKFLNLTSDERVFNQFKISFVEIHKYVRLDNAALYSLNILPKPRDTVVVDGFFSKKATQSFSLKGVLDTCVTSQGTRLLEQWIKQPLKDINLINERLDIVESLVKDSHVRSELHSAILTRLSDLMMLSKKLSSKRANLQDCYRIYQIVGAIPKLIKLLTELDNVCVKSILIDHLSEIYHDLENYQKMIEEILDLELVDQGEFLVKRTFDAELDELFVKKEKIEEKMQKVFRCAANDLGFEAEKSIKLDRTDQLGYFFRVTLKDELNLRSNKRYKIIGAIKGGVRFTNDDLERLNQNYRDTIAEYEEQQKNVFQEISEVAAGYGHCLRNLNLYVATVDVLVSFANVAVSARIPYVRPKFSESRKGALKLFKVRHPCIEQQDHISFIPNSVEFDHNDKTLYIITGPNMCGKSTFIRSVGVCVLMAQIGCFVPCSYAEFPVVDAILARVGAEDCQLKGLSTFMLEMIEASTIIKTATEDSLVIIDELGRGTSTYDGCGIAFSIAEHLAKKVKAFTLMATHFHEITRLADMCPSVGNKHVVAITTENTITPLYQVKEGECDHSYGIHCARMAEFPKDVIESAISHQQTLEHEVGFQFIKDFEPAAKRQAIEEGDKIIEDTLLHLKSHLSDEEWIEEVKKLKSELEKNDNLFIKGLLSE